MDRLPLSSFHAFGAGLLLLMTLGGWPDGPPDSGGEPAHDVRRAELSNWFPVWGPVLTWTDVRHAGGWRLQRSNLDERFRLLSPQDRVVQVGSREACEAALENAVREEGISPPRGTVVVVLHGLIRSRRSMLPMARELARPGDWTVINFEYASARGSIAEHAEALRCVLAGLGEGVTEVHFVGHSLGNLVVRNYLAGRGSEGPRLGRMVMLGPPNQGAMAARLLRGQWWFTILGGEPGVQLSTTWEPLEPTLAVPDCEFGIIAGGASGAGGWDNWLLPGRDDGTVRVVETELAGAADRLELPLLHGTMMRDRRVIAATVHFLREGRFPGQTFPPEPERGP